MSIYRIYSVFDDADTWRDPSQLHYTELGCTTDLDKALEFGKKYIKENFIKKDLKLEKLKNGNYSATDWCSYGKTLKIDKMDELE